MSYPLPLNSENMGTSLSAGITSSPPSVPIFSVQLAFSAGAAADTAIATLSNPIAGETLSLTPADGKVRLDGNALEVGGTPTPSAVLLYYTLTRSKDGVSTPHSIIVRAV